MEQEISPTRVFTPFDSEYLLLCNAVRKEFFKVFKYALNSNDCDKKVEVAISVEFTDEATVGITANLNIAISNWFDGYKKRMAEVGIVWIVEEELTFEFTAILREMCPRATAEASPGLQKRMDVFLPNLKHGIAIIVEVAFYYGSEKEKTYFARDAYNSKHRKYLVQCEHLPLISPGVKLGRKLDQVYDYFVTLKESEEAKKIYRKYACIALIVAHDANAERSIKKSKVMSLVRVFNHSSNRPKVQPRFGAH
uniref:Uncharacterized protein n=1 Tax=Ditylenchus dipsaci TaxID=166011 RepID=A0A915DB10_9BILA